MIVNAGPRKAIDFNFFTNLTKKLFISYVFFLRCDTICVVPDSASREKRCQPNYPVQNAATPRWMKSSGSSHEKACGKRVFLCADQLRLSSL